MLPWSEPGRTTLEVRTGAWRPRRPLFREARAPCQTACPADEAIPRWVERARAGDYACAWAMIRQTNPFPAVTGRVCAHPCVPGWGIADDASLHLARLAVESRVVPLYEVEDGSRYRITHRPTGVPVAEYLRAQARYAHLTATDVATLQAEVDGRWAALAARADHP